MILVDTSVWIDFFGGRPTPRTLRLEELVKLGAVCIGDLVMVELLQGIRSDREFEWTRRYLGALPIVGIVDSHVIVAAARNYRQLRSLGFTIRSTIDALIATRCIRDDLPILTSDRDFKPFVEHLGLRDAMAEA